MGSFTLAVEATSRDVDALLTLHRVHPQVRSDVRRLLQHLVTKSYEHMESLQPGYEESSEQICRTIASDLINKVVTIAIPVSQLSREEEQSASYYQELQDTKRERDELRKHHVDTQIVLKDLKKAHDYMLHSYFHEVLILRQRISDLQLQQKRGVGIGVSGLSTAAGGANASGNGASGVHRVSYGSFRSVNSRLSASVATESQHGSRSEAGSGGGGAPAVGPMGAQGTYHLGDALRSSTSISLSPQKRPTAAPNRESVQKLSHTMPEGRNSLPDVSSPPAFMQTARFGTTTSAAAREAATATASDLQADTSAPFPARTPSPSPSRDGESPRSTSPTVSTGPVDTAQHRGTGQRPHLSPYLQQQQHHQSQLSSPRGGQFPMDTALAAVATSPGSASETAQMMLYTIAHPHESVDAVFDYERYVSLLNGVTGSWDDRYIELLVAKEEAEEQVIKERSKRRIGFQFSKAERRDRVERMEHELKLGQAQNNKWWWAQKLAVEEVQRDFAERIAEIREDMDTLRSTMMHDYIFNLQQAMSLLQSRIDVLLNFILVYVKATDETIRTIQRDARARTRADLLIADHHAQSSTTTVTTFFDNPENERERPNIASELIRLQGAFWDVEEKQKKTAEAKSVHPLYLTEDTAKASATATTATTSGREATEAFRHKARKTRTTNMSDEDTTAAAAGTAGTSPGEAALASAALGETLNKSLSAPPPPLTGPYAAASVVSSQTPATYKTDGLPYWEAHPITESATKVFQDLQGLARKLRLRKAVQLENEIRITSARGQRGRGTRRDRLYGTRPQRSSSKNGAAAARKKKKGSGKNGNGNDASDEDDADDVEIAKNLTESANWAMNPGWEDLCVGDDEQNRTARDIIKELVQLRFHRIVNTVRRRTTLHKLQDILDIMDDGLTGGKIRRSLNGKEGRGGQHREGRTGSRSRTTSATSAAAGKGGRTRTKEDLLSIEYLRHDDENEEMDSEEEMDIRVAMLTKVCEVAEDRIQDDTLRINALLRLLRNHKLTHRDWEKERKESEEERIARVAREKAEREAHLARLMQSPYWKQPPQQFYGRGGGSVAFLPAGLLQARERPMASHVYFQGEKIPINAFLQQGGEETTGDAGETSPAAAAVPSLASRVVTRGQKRTPYAAVMDYCQGVQMGLPMSNRRGPVYLQYDATKDAYYVADDEGTDLVAEGQRRVTQLLNSMEGSGDASANNIFNAPRGGEEEEDDDDEAHGHTQSLPAWARRGGGGRMIDRWTVPMTQILFPAPAPTRGEATASAPGAAGGTNTVHVPGTQRDGAYVFITNPDDVAVARAGHEDAAALSSQTASGGLSVNEALAPLYLVPITLPVEDTERTLFGGERGPGSVLYTTSTDPSYAAAAYGSAPYPLLPPEDPLAYWWSALHSPQLRSFWLPHTQAALSATSAGGAAGAASGSLARVENPYYHDPPMIFRPPTEEQRMLAISGVQLHVPASEPVPSSYTRQPTAREEEAALGIRYDGEGRNYTSLFPPGSTFYSASGTHKDTQGKLRPVQDGEHDDGSSNNNKEAMTSSSTPPRDTAAPPTSIIQDPLRAAATSIAKTRQLREARAEQLRQAAESAQLERQLAWKNRGQTLEPTEKERFLRLRLPHLAPMVSSSGTTGDAALLLSSCPEAAVTSTACSFPPPPAAGAAAPSLASVSLSKSSPAPLDAVRLQQQLRANRGKPLVGASHLAGPLAVPSARTDDVVDKRLLGTATTTTASPSLAMPTAVLGKEKSYSAEGVHPNSARFAATMPSPGASLQPSSTMATTKALTGEDAALASAEKPLRLPAEFVQITQTRSATETTTRGVGFDGRAASRKTRKI